MFVGALLCALGCTACPTYEDGYTGTYQEIDFEPHQDEVVSVEFYRFGGDSRAMVRYFKRTSLSAAATPFAPQNQTRCVWTKTDAFDEDSLSFSLSISPTARHFRTEVNGRIGDDGAMSLQIIEEGLDKEIRPIRLIKVSDDPRPDCDQIDDFLVYTFFEGTLDPEIHTMRHPVLAVMWVGVEPIRRDNVIFQVAFNRPEPVIRLEPGRQFEPEFNGFPLIDGQRMRLNFSIPPPSERLLVQSGDTRYALAHLVVIDDRDSEGRFSWEISEEPIVATALQRGRLPDAPENSNGWGKALLFVEGKLSDLDPGLVIMEGVEDIDGDGHFYVVDIFFQDDEIVLLRLPPPAQAGLVSDQARRVPLKTTEDYLGARGVLLPRLFP